MSVPRPGDIRRERRFYSGMAIAFAIVAFVGFAPSYYLRTFSDQPPLPWPVHVHGLLFTGWILLLLTQTRLIASHQIRPHRRLGVAGGVLALLMTLSAAVVTFNLMRRAVEIPEFLGFLVVPFGALVVFPALVVAAFIWRRRPDIHKRLMLLATIEIMNAAVDRLPGVAPAGLTPFYAGTDLFLLALVIYDIVTLRRLHPATIWGGLFLIATQVLRMALMGSGSWLSLATWLAR